MDDSRWGPCRDLAVARQIQQRATGGLLRVERPGEVRHRPKRQTTPTDGTEAIVTWLALLDWAEAAMQSGDLDDPYVQRTASRLLDSVYLYEHQMTAEARRLAREFVWLRDHNEPLPPAAERLYWERCLCRSCLVERVLHRPSVDAALRRLPAPCTKQVTAIPIQEALQLPA